MVSDAAPGEQRARRIESLVEQLLERVGGDPAEQWYAAPTADDWTVMQSLAHVAELLPYWTRQAQDVAARSEHDQPFGRTHDDPARIAAVEAHAHDRPEHVTPRIRAALVETAVALRAIPAPGWARTGRHARRGEMSVEQIVDQFLIEHMEEHLAQVDTILRSPGPAAREMR